jgi:Integral membrane protein (intg_mem_TP0381)
MQLNWYYFISLLFTLWCLNHFKEANLVVKEHFLHRLSTLSIFTYLFNLYYFTKFAHILTLLPLQLCNIAVILIPYALKTYKKPLIEFLFYVCGLGALSAILIVSKEYQATYSLFTFSFYTFHFLIFLIPTLLWSWGFCRIDPQLKTAYRLTIVLIVLSLFIHSINLVLNAFNVPANYFFTIIDLSIKSNEAFLFFASIIPFDYFYLYLVFPILYIYMLVIHLILKIRKHPTHPFNSDTL